MAELWKGVVLDHVLVCGGLVALFLELRCHRSGTRVSCSHDAVDEGTRLSDSLL